MIKRTRVLGGLLALAAAASVAVAAPPGDDGPRWSTAAAAADARPTEAKPTDAESAEPADTDTDHGRLRALLRRLTTVDGGPGALLEMRDRRGRKVLTSGVADVQSQAPVRRDSRFRIGSMTKPFTATVMLQLVGERRVALDAPVERYLPGVVRGHGNDGRKITVRQLLQHTSGVPEFLEFLSPAEILKDPLAHRDMRDLVDIAIAHPRTFEPGKGWRYSNTNYLLAGMIIEKVTGHSYGDEIRRRVIEPLGLHDTSVPTDDPAIPGPHPRGYTPSGEDEPLRDITAISPTVGGPSGAVISNGTDVNRFFDALVSGRLLHPAQLREMMKTRPTGDPDSPVYGLGLESWSLPCGGRYWGHTGEFPGYETLGGATTDGRRATVMVNLGPGPDAQSDDMKTLVGTALCKGRPHRG